MAGVAAHFVPMDIDAFHTKLSPGDQAICDLLRKTIDATLPEAESKIWHRHPVWFLDGNPIVGYSRLKDAVRLMFWSGQSFETPGLKPTGTFKAAEVRFTDLTQVDVARLGQWLTEARDKQWDYGNIVKRKGQLLPLKGV